jgi:hypothetical protein
VKLVQLAAGTTAMAVILVSAAQSWDSVNAVVGIGSAAAQSAGTGPCGLSRPPPKPAANREIQVRRWGAWWEHR